MLDEAYRNRNMLPVRPDWLAARHEAAVLHMGRHVAAGPTLREQALVDQRPDDDGEAGEHQADEVRVPVHPAQRIAAHEHQVDHEQHERDEEEAELFDEAAQHDGR